MAHTKSAGSAKRTVDIIGKRLGIKKYGDEHVMPGNIIVRQRGSTFHAGRGTMAGKDFTIFAVAEGFVHFKRMTGYKRGQKAVYVLPKKFEEGEKATKKAVKKEEVKVEAKAKTTKAAVKAKTATTKTIKAKKTA